MDTSTVVWVLVVTLVCVVGIITVRSKLGVELKGTDIGIAALIFAIGLVVTGQIAEFEFGGSTVKLREELESQISVPETTVYSPEDPNEVRSYADAAGRLSYTVISVDCPLNLTPKFATRETRDLAVVVADYFWSLPSDYVVFTETDDCSSIKSILGSRRFYALATLSEFQTMSNFVRSKWNREQDDRDDEDISLLLSGPEFKEQLEENPDSFLFLLPSLVRKGEAIAADARKIDALNQMIGLGVLALPIVAKDGDFLHIIERDELTASLLADFGRAVSE